MKIEEFRAELEEDQTWRRDEIRILQNRLLRNESSGEDDDRVRRALILMIYAHFEGFCKFALVHYIKAVNQVGITCAEANFNIVTATLEDVFRALTGDKKIREFRNNLPDDNKLHKFAREVEFVQRTNEFDSRIVKISEDFIDMESNLKPIVLRKNLYRLGFQYDLFKDKENDINKLLEYRNQIAHGQSKRGISEKDYVNLRDSIYLIMDKLVVEVMNAFQHKQFLRETV